MTPVVNPLVDGAVAQPVQSAPPSGSTPDDRASAGPTGMAAFAGNFTHPDNTSAHVAVLVAIAGAVIAFLYWGGFKFAVDAGVMRP